MPVRLQPTTVRPDRERGQVVLLFALLVPMILAVGGIVVGIGNWYVHAKNLQTKADSGALAGGVSWAFPCAADIDTKNHDPGAPLRRVEEYASRRCAGLEHPPRSERVGLGTTTTVRHHSRAISRHRQGRSATRRPSTSSSLKTTPSRFLSLIRCFPTSSAGPASRSVKLRDSGTTADRGPPSEA